MDSVFGDRHEAGERMWSKMRGYGKGDIAFALSDGGVEFAYPTVHLRGEPPVLRLLDVLRPRVQPGPNALRIHSDTRHIADVPGVRGEHTWIFDDGEVGDDVICKAARLLRVGGAATVRVATAVASRRLCRQRHLLDRVLTLRWRDDLPMDTALWATSPRSAAFWLADLTRERTWEAFPL